MNVSSGSPTKAPSQAKLSNASARRVRAHRGDNFKISGMCSRGSHRSCYAANCACAFHRSGH